MVAYHGLARRDLTPLGLLMRPQLNGATLARQERHREFGSRIFLFEHSYLSRLVSLATSCHRCEEAD